jgi:predicted transcriptional regulator
MAVDISNLGELEMSVLEYVWEHGETDVKKAHEDIGVERGITHNTVQSTFKRLWEKGLLERTKQGRAYVYASNFDRKELTELMVGDLVDQVAGADVSVALEAFVNLADRAGDSTLEALEQLVASRRSARGESDE